MFNTNVRAIEELIGEPFAILRTDREADTTGAIVNRSYLVGLSRREYVVDWTFTGHYHLKQTRPPTVTA